MTTRRQFVQLGAAALAGAALPVAALAQGSAQNWPTRPIRAMIPFAAGSSLDIVGRIVMDPLAAQLGQPIVIENRGGAGGTIGTALVAKSDPDGYSILIQASAHSAAPAAYSNIGYDVAKDFIAVIPFGTLPNVTVVSPASGIKTLKDLVAKAKSGPITYASAGTGNANHVAAEMFKMMTGIEMVHVPYRGGAPALIDLVGGRVQVMFADTLTAGEQLKGGLIRALAVATPQRSPVLPDAPPISDTVPGFDASSWWGIGAPRGTPEEIVNKLNQSINAGLADPKLRARFADMGAQIIGGSPADFGKMIADETDKWGKVVKFAGASAE